MDKTQTKEFVFSLRLILVGIFFWIIKIRYFTFFWLPEFHFLNVFGLEVVGTILILIGITIINRVYPFAYAMLANFLIYIILILNILDFFLFRFWLYRELQQYVPFVMSILLIVIAKLLESGIKYFGNKDLSRKWKYLAVIIFFGFSIPFYSYVTLNIVGVITYEGFALTLKVILMFIPIVLSLIFFFLYYIHILLKSFQYLANVEKNGLKTDK